MTGSFEAKFLSEDATEAEASQLLSEGRERAYIDLVLEVKKLNANVIVNFQWQSRAIDYETFEIYAAGTALIAESNKSEPCKACGKMGKRCGKNHKFGGKDDETVREGKKSKKKERRDLVDTDTQEEDGETEEDEEEDEDMSEREKNKSQRWKGENNRGKGVASRQYEEHINELDSVSVFLKSVKFLSRLAS